MLWFLIIKIRSTLRRIGTGDNAILLWFIAIIFMDTILYGLLFYNWEYGTNPNVNSPLDFIWYSFITMTTIGYGDIYPITSLGRIVTIPFTLISLTCFGGVISILGAKLMVRHERRMKGLTKLNVDGHVILVDCSEDARKKEIIARIIESLRQDWETESWPIVIVAQGYEQLPDPLPDFSNVYFCQGSVTTELPYNRANISAAKVAIILSRSSQDAQVDDAISLAALQVIKYLNPRIEARAECANLEHEPLFKAAGCEAVINMRALESHIMAKSVVDPDTAPVILQMLNPGVGNTLHTIRQTNLEGVTFGSIETALEEDKEKIMTIGISKYSQKQQLLNPDDETLIEMKDRLIVLAKKRPKWKGKEGMEHHILEKLQEEE
ncbi:TPA: potassium channel protein [Candidatus Poribacteria bacterium]|nr:potassium channel protein [Candidatus Poribacteria bacterium]